MCLPSSGVRSSQNWVKRGNSSRPGHGGVDREAARRQAVLVERAGSAEVGGALIRQPVGLQAVAVHHAKAGKAEIVRQLSVQPGLAEGEVVGGVENLARLAVRDLVQPDRQLGVPPEMEELHGERRAAVRPKRPLRLEADLLERVVVDRLQDVGMADHRLLVGLIGERLGLSPQPFEVERPGRPEFSLSGLGGGSHQAAIEQGGERADARGEQRLAAIELHGTPEEAFGCRANPSIGRASGGARSSGGALDIATRRRYAKVPRAGRCSVDRAGGGGRVDPGLVNLRRCEPHQRRVAIESSRPHRSMVAPAAPRLGAGRSISSARYSFGSAKRGTPPPGLTDRRPSAGSAP